MNEKLINTVKGVLFLIIASYLALTFDKALSNLVTKSGLSWVYASVILRIIISLAFGRGFQLLLKALNIKLKGIITFMIGTLIGFTVSFIARPIYTIDYGNYGQSNLTLNIDSLYKHTNYKLNLNNKPALVCFFSTDCEGCKLMSSELGRLQKLGHTPQIIANFAGTEEDAKIFMTNTNGENYQYFMVKDKDYFAKTCDYIFPSVYLIDKDEKTVLLWHSNGLSYNDLDLIKDYK